MVDPRRPRRPQHNELHKKSIATHIQEHIATVNAVLILANGTVPGTTAGTSYALSAFVPKTLANNVAFLFTNTTSPLYLNFYKDTVPEILKDAPVFHFYNPIALQKKFLELTNDLINAKERRKGLKWRDTVKDTEEQGLGMLVDLFDWMGGREPQPTREIVALYETSQAIETKITNTIAQMDQVAAMIAEVNKLVKAVQTNSVSPLLYSHLAFLCMSNVGTRGSGDN